MKDTSAGAAVYSPLLLGSIYDSLVHGLYLPYAWRCSASKMLSFFGGNISYATTSSSEPPQRRTPRILDIGVGTGYFLEHAPIVDDTEVVLADLNPACLEASKTRLAKTHPRTTCETIIADFLNPGEEGLVAKLRGGDKFDAISMILLLHCLPGPPTRKAEALVSLRQLLQPTGVMFGATVLGRGVRHNIFGKFLMFWHNLLGVFGNHDDELESFIGPLKDGFESVEWEIVGAMLLFEAKGPKT
ncbi:hypothetical protein TWF106_008135 [Orbilia oligospora]|uniref:Methyltransferase type 12 domain-containing protein n=1 Tax=Orbilia oligospora TaxID=2813651 RepID=A0A6G1MJX1_ORBOL|nr:hypothetical protein TWF106_008135 [Orbilia oligospora]KAF3225988.1 hypothetical protein TWF191_005014 [Orbilia oligospora]KAF3259707.1 hypothetical protein TWF192_010562 [Orbilia oligospora]